jgi:hypothetical protein
MVAIGQSIDLYAWPVDQYGNAVKATLSWASSDTTVIKVVARGTQGGTPTAVGLGTATITRN